MKKFLLYVLVGAFVIITGLWSCPYAYAAEEIAIGAIFPLSGSVAPIGRTVRQGLDMAAMEVNREGGIKSLGGAKVKLVYADSRGDPKIGLSEAERLIVKDKVSAILGAYQSSVTLTSTQVAERHRVPYVTVIAVADSITERGFKYVFRTNETADMTGKLMLGFLSDMSKMTGKPVKTLGFLYENTEWGQSSAKSWHKYSKEYGFEVILDEPYPTGTTDITPVIIKFKQKNPDAVVNVSYISDIILIVKTMAENRWAPKAFISGGGGEIEPEFIPAAGDLAEYNYSVLPWAPDLLLVQPWAEKMAEEFKNKSNVELSCNSAEAYAIFNVLMDAIERAGSKDRERIREALVKTNITQEGAETNMAWRRALLLPYKRIAFGSDGQNPHVRIPICQFQKRELRIIFPSDIVPPGIKPVWPAPSWDERQ